MSVAKVLIYCGTGYTFEEIYKTLIKEQGEDWEIVLLVADFYITESTIQTINNLILEKKLVEYHLVPMQIKSLFQIHKAINQLIRLIKKKKFDLFLLGCDVNIVDRYLLALAKSQDAIVVILSTSTMWQVLAEYRKRFVNTSKASDYYGKLIKIKGTIGKIKAILKNIKNRIRSIKRLGKKIRSFQSHYLLPLIFSKQVFPKNRYDNLAFTAGRADAVICYDSLEIEALKTVVPSVGNVYLANHPSTGLCRCGKNPTSESKKKLLVMFNGNLATELDGENFERWVGTIKRAIDLAKPKEIHLRCHPRISEHLVWPQRFSEAIRAYGCEVKRNEPLKTSLLDIICDYDGIIGGPSGSLRVARAVCKNVFIIGLPNCGDGSQDDQEWILGTAEGIVWIQEGKEFEEKHLIIPHLDVEKRNSISEILQGILSKRKGPLKIIL